MVNINGISIKDVKSTLGHDGELLASASVYKDGEKIGIWKQGDWGGSDEFSFDLSLIEKAVRDYKNSIPTDTPEGIMKQIVCNCDLFMSELLELTVEVNRKGEDDEKTPT